MLLKEASVKEEATSTSIVQKELLSDFQSHIQTIKEAMARQIGGSTLRNSGWNTTWQEVDASPRIEAIKQEIEQKFGNYFNTIINGRQVPIKAGIEVSPDRKTGDEPEASIYFRYRYHRTIMPEKNPDALNKANKAIRTLHKLLPGFRDFQEDIEEMNIPLNPYFHISSFSKNDGRVTPENLQNFITNERNRYASNPLKSPNGEPINANSFYAAHQQRIQAGRPVRMTDYVSNTRNYDIADAGNIRDHGPLMRAIADKVRQGYKLNVKTLLADTRSMYQDKVKKHKLNPRSKDPTIQGYINSYFNLYTKKGRNIQKFFTQGCASSKDPVHDDYHWGEDPSGKIRQGLPTEMSNRVYNCPKLDTNELRLMLQHLTVWSGDGQEPEGGSEKFQVSKMTNVYQANGWDSSPNDPRTQMLTLPPMRQLPNQEVRYDRDNGNFGRTHLVLNWKTGLLPILTKWGRQCDAWLKQLRDPNFIASIGKNSPEVVAAAQNVMSLQTGNRTGAENVADILNKYRNWKDFQDHHLGKTMVSEITSVNDMINNPSSNAQSSFLSPADLQSDPRTIYQKVLQIASRLNTLDPTMMSQEIAAMSHMLVGAFQNGVLRWDALTLCLSEINKASKTKEGVQGNGIVGLNNADADTMIDESGFKLLQQYGYQTAKVMDFLYATMARSCHEVINTHGSGETENFYGHQYSTSSGKSGGGEVILSVRYAYFAPELTNDPQVAQKIRNEQGKRHVKQDIVHQRQTQHWQQAEPTGRFTDPKDPSTEVGIMQPLPGMPEGSAVKIVENIEYFIGQGSGSNKMIKTLHSGLPWEQMVDLFVESYPDIGLQLDVVFEPMNANLNRLELACKRAVDKVRQGLPVAYVNSKKQETILTADSINREEMKMTGQLSQENMESPTGNVQPQQQATSGGQTSTQQQVSGQPGTTWTQEFPQPTTTDTSTVDMTSQQPPISTPQPATPVPVPTASPATKKPRSKSMEGPYVGYIGKGKNTRSLFKRPKMSFTYDFENNTLIKQSDLEEENMKLLLSHQERLIDNNQDIVGSLTQIATKIDELGYIKTADKIDMLCKELEKHLSVS